MWTVGALSFAVPWALAGLISLPVIWWILRLKPPLPRRIIFPPIVLLQRLTSKRESPARIPPWLLALRLLLAAFIVAGIARPLLNAETKLFGEGPLYLIIDDDWAAAAGWAARQSTAGDMIDHAERQGRPIVLVPTAPAPEGAAPPPPALMSADQARRAIQTLQPKPWPSDRAAAINNLLADSTLRGQRPGDVMWLGNAIEQPTGAESAKTAAGGIVTMAALTQRLRALGAVTLFSASEGQRPIVLRQPVTDGPALEVRAERVDAVGGRGIQVRALAADGETLARVPVVFSAGKRSASARLDLPAELRNRLARLEIEGIQSAAAVVLVDERWRRRPVGLMTSSGGQAEQPLLDAFHYLGQAIEPFTEIRKGSVSELLGRGLAVLMLADPGRLPLSELKGVEAWLDQGGVVLRFAGPRLAREAGAGDPLLPVQLRRGDRAIGGALSWRKPEQPAPFARTSPFHGLDVPADIKVRRQVLAQPSLDLADRTWARLSDGTPLVTAQKRGQGWLVLVHTTANAEWSDLAFSGLFVGMLRRLVQLSQGVAADGSGAPLPPIANLDAFGRLGDPPGGATAIAADTFTKAKVSPAHPPGLYGTAVARRALNLSDTTGRLQAISNLPAGVETRSYARSLARDLQAWLLVFAALLFLVDLVASMMIRGLLGRGLNARMFRPALGSGVMVFCITLAAAAHGDDTFARENSLETRLAYVITGNRNVDNISDAGLTGLNTILWRRTAAELGPPQGIDPSVDDLSFFPLLYWPVVSGYVLPQGAAPNVVNYLRNGGTILFDTRDQAENAGGATLSRLARELEIPRLVPVGPSHVLTRSFYLLKEFPGRWTGGALWVEIAGERINDGVSPVIAGGHDWAAAWAIDENQRPIFPVVPGGERQREMAYRFGVNLVMYTLTGNYKADQVHMPAIIRRLGQ